MMSNDYYNRKNHNKWVDYIGKRIGVIGIESIREKLRTKCTIRLGLTHGEYKKFCNICNVIGDYNIRMEDLIKFRKESYIKLCCRRLKIGIDKLRWRLYRSNIEGFDNVRMRSILGIKLSRSEIKLNCRSKEEKIYERRIIKLWEAGYSYREISEIIGRSFGSIIGKVHRIRKNSEGVCLLRRRGGFNKDNEKIRVEIINLLNSGKSFKDVSERYNKKVGSLHSLVSTWRIKYPELGIRGNYRKV